MERRSTLAAGLRPLRLQPLPPGFFDAPAAIEAPEPLSIHWHARGGTYRLAGDAAAQARFRDAVAAHDAALTAAAIAQVGGDVRGFFAQVTESHRCAAVLETFDLAPTDLDRLQARARRRAQAAARKARRAA